MATNEKMKRDSIVPIIIIIIIIIINGRKLIFITY
jgi:hypothetical protein